ncbi:uncharacterized protein LOC111985155 [Quercus suber]|uniref:uncharacterized protein LOC111985155 n=1 Tax=Quercus suber TaxID=58331 RepID=UPI0032E024C8
MAFNMPSPISSVMRVCGWPFFFFPLRSVDFRNEICLLQKGGSRRPDLCFTFYITIFREWLYGAKRVGHKVQVSFQPFVLRSQLYSGVKDRTQVDRELEVISDLFVKCIFIFVFSAS